MVGIWDANRVLTTLKNPVGKKKKRIQWKRQNHQSKITEAQNRVYNSISKKGQASDVKHRLMRAAVSLFGMWNSSLLTQKYCPYKAQACSQGAYSSAERTDKKKWQLVLLKSSWWRASFFGSFTDWYLKRNLENWNKNSKHFHFCTYFRKKSNISQSMDNHCSKVS